MDAALNWLWQGGVVALATACILRAISPARPRVRYAAAWAGCAAVLALPLVPLAWDAASPAASLDGPTDAAIVSMPPHWWTSTRLVMGMWALWLAVQTSRVAVAAAALRRVKRTSRAVPPSLEARLPHWRRLSAVGRRTRLVLSEEVGAAAVLGGASPLIAIAPTILHDLDDADVDRIVVHEWAHVQRRDDFAQGLQLLVHIIAGWHPAIWWIGGRLHVEREIACDEIAVGATGSAKAYAACLASLARLPAVSTRWLPAVVPSAACRLRVRVTRILRTHPPAARHWRSAAVMSAACLAAVAFGVGQQRVFGTAPSPVTMFEAKAVSWAAALTSPVSMTANEVPRASLPGHAAGRVPAANRTASAGSSLSASRVTGAAREPAASSASVPQPNVGREPAVLSPGISLASRATALAPAIDSTSPDGASPRVDAGRAAWSAAGDAGKAIGRGSTNAALATARFFTRFGRTVADSF